MRTVFTPVALFLLVFAPLAQAQYYGQQQYGQPPPQDQGVLYGTQKAPPPVVVIEQGYGAPGIPTSGVQQQRQLAPNNSYRAPTVIYHDRKDKGLTVITGPNGTTICRDYSGRTVVCY